MKKLWIVATTLQKVEAGKTTLSGTLSHRLCETEEEAIGSATIFAMKEKPDFTIAMITASTVSDMTVIGAYAELDGGKNETNAPETEAGQAAPE